MGSQRAGQDWATNTLAVNNNPIKLHKKNKCMDCKEHAKQLTNNSFFVNYLNYLNNYLNNHLNYFNNYSFLCS